jgi:hypothetical protein
MDISSVSWHRLPARKTTAKPVLSTAEGMAVLHRHRGGFDLEEQVGTADVAYDRY